MKRHPNLYLLLILFWLVLLTGLIACGEEPPPPVQQPATVSKKIDAESPTPPAAVPATEPATPAAPSAPAASEQAAMDAADGDTPAEAASPESGIAVSPEGVDTVQAGESVAQAEESPPQEISDSSDAALASEIATAEPSDLVRESLQMAVTYDPTGRFDPFEPLFRSEPESSTETEQTASQRRERRVPQTPLERVALSQLKVTAIIRAETGNRALVEDGTGKGYVVTKGTYMGLNAGRVIEIDAGRIVVEEEIENVMGELRIQLAELKLQKPPGEF
ncbi:pilus assembly protein PilP [Desulfatitalea alkaliphila]|uniref:Pilus assembly protein PilP n=1 Tax=Desulfatitalea alkaliphila TaxID=2929485 RepID=A0AA41UK95_9BACT|nr:pilus assembly protein PilP [Desulfatitalea alkaliphila]MCJ8502079.1 pilus assembly protein PilP [Desulfatitalea alkaliphila]